MNFNVIDYLTYILGCDLTAIEGIGTYAALKLLVEIGNNMGLWKTGKHFASWLALCPHNKITGDKLISSKTRKVPNRAAAVLRMCAQSVQRTDTPLGRYFRRMRAKSGAAEATTTTAHKMARIIYSMIKNRREYNPSVLEEHEKNRELNRIEYHKKMVKKHGYDVIKFVELDVDELTSETPAAKPKASEPKEEGSKKVA